MPSKWLVSSRDDNNRVLDAEVAHTLLKAQEAGARMVFDLTLDLFSNQSRQQQNAALLWDGLTTLAISVERCRVTMEPIKEK